MIDKDRDLVLTRDLDASAEALYRCWTEPELLARWFAPRPLTARIEAFEARPGGAFDSVMTEPDGTEHRNAGVFLELVPNRRIVTTDAFVEGWRPSGRPFMVAVMTFEPLGEGRARYVAVARHWSAEDRRTHEQMGFHEGWGLCADQLAEAARGL